MEVLPVLDFTVKSSVHNYEVKFIEDAINILKNEIRDGDVIIIDNKVKLLNPYLLKDLNYKIILFFVLQCLSPLNSHILNPFVL